MSKTPQETINELCKTLSCYQADIKKKDQEIAELKERLKPFLERERKEIAHQEAMNDFGDLSDSIRIKGPRGCPEGQQDDNRQ
jgi:flagellar motility protein MotE (MotC chaperone)